MSQQPFGDIPLFRELQRLLESGDGPINMEIARQVGVAVATQGYAEQSAAPEISKTLDEVVHRAEQLVGGYTRLEVDQPARVRVVGRAEWVTATLEDWRWLLEGFAGRFTEEIGRLMAQEATEQPVQGPLAGVSPLLVGIQAGSLVGQLAAESLAHHDWPVPRASQDTLMFLWPNAKELADGYDWNHARFAAWLGVREVSRRTPIAAVPWVPHYFRSLLNEIIASIEIDMADLERRMMELQTQGMEQLQEGVGPDGMFPLVATERHSKGVDRLHAFIALFEAYARRAAVAIEQELVEEPVPIDEGMRRHELSPGAGKAMLSALLGIDVAREVETAAENFCAAVAQLKGPGALNRVWDAPDNLPGLAELKDPFAWMERALTE